MKLSMIVAMAENGVIGRDNDLPFRISADLKRFKSLTMGHPVIMGRKTYDSIGRLLPGRENVILTRNVEFHVDGATILRNPEQVLERFKGEDEVFVIGGEQIYGAFLSKADRLYMTQVHQVIEGDTWFPDFDRNDFVETSRQRWEIPLPHTYIVLDRK